MSFKGNKQPELSPAKREQILDGARALFRELGYERASVDAIAAKAGVSKATIYNHFRSKEALFLSTFGAETEKLRLKFHSLLETPSGDVEADLRQIGEDLLRLVCAPSNVCRQRVVSAEAARFPELGVALHAGGIQAGRERMARFFERAASMGLLDVEDAEEAAVDFASLCIGDLSKELQLGIRREATEEDIAANVRRGVRTFLRAYLPRGFAGPGKTG